LGHHRHVCFHALRIGRLIDDGIVARYLDERCPDPALRLCAYKATLPEDADVWLWGDTPFYKLGGWADYGREETDIIFATLARYPLTHLDAAVTATLRQFASFQTEVSLQDNEPTAGTFEDRTPQLYLQFVAARQQKDQIDVDMLNRVHVPLATLALAGLAGALMFCRRLNVAPELAALCLTVMLALSFNAAICGVFSHPVDRYQSRLMPLALLAMALLAAGYWRRSRPAPHLGPPADLV